VQYELDVTVQPSRWPEKRPEKSKKKLGSSVSVVFGLWERFLTAITRGKSRLEAAPTNH
jgi:hypothetical protein